MCSGLVWYYFFCGKNKLLLFSYISYVWLHSAQLIGIGGVTTCQNWCTELCPTFMQSNNGMVNSVFCYAIDLYVRHQLTGVECIQFRYPTWSSHYKSYVYLDSPPSNTRYIHNAFKLHTALSHLQLLFSLLILTVELIQSPIVIPQSPPLALLHLGCHMHQLSELLRYTLM